MTQLIYAIAALGIVAVVSVSMQGSSNAGQTAVYRNEVLTQLVTVGRDMVDQLARQDLPFDQKVDPDRIPQPATYPYVHTPGDLTASSSFGGLASGSALTDAQDLDDVDGLTIVGERSGLPYEAEFEVRYVSDTNPNGEASGQTFAKEVIVTVTSDAVIVNGSPVSATYSRVITYPQITNYTY